jgi:DNA replication regulator DPB11
LQETISANGGEYHGDLTKEVTHLIAYTAEGKKYQYATQWAVKVVGLKWLKDSLDRHMILEENLYHPTIPNNKQGAGAWNRQAKAELQLGKRTRDEDPVPDVPRKLRRTTSAKLGSQSESMWDEIVSGPQVAELKSNDQIRISKSLPVLKPAILEPKSFATDSTGGDDDRRRLATKDLKTSVQQRSKTGIFAGSGFYLFAFSPKEVSKQVKLGAECFANIFPRRQFCNTTYSAMTEWFLSF